MSLDRRIVSILYYNGINDVNKIEKFIGEKNGYYEIIIDNKIEKLKIPGKYYIEEIEEIIETAKELQKKSKKEKIQKTQKEKKIEKLEKLESNGPEIEFEFDEEVIKSDNEKKEILHKLENNNKKIKKPQLKNKNLDDDINDFINTI